MLLYFPSVTPYIFAANYFKVKYLAVIHTFMQRKKNEYFESMKNIVILNTLAFSYPLVILK